MKHSLAIWIAAIVAVGLVSREARASGPVTLQQGSQFSNTPTTWCVNPRARPPSPPDDPAKDRHLQVAEADADENPISTAGEGGSIDGSFDLGRGSKLITVSMGWIGTGVEHVSATGALSSPRRTPTGALAAPRKGELPALTLRRFHDPRHPSYPSSFGPGVFSGYDLSLTLARANLVPGFGTVMLYDPRDIALRALDYDPVTKIYVDRSYCSIDGLRLLDAGGQATEDQAAAVTAVLTARNGWTFTFEIIRTVANVASPQRFGRLIREQDRNGNKVEIAYQLAANTPDAQLGVDRSKLWKVATVTDAYGRVATFTYNPVKKDGRWVVSSVTLPNGSSTLYNYKENNQLGLTSVVHADGRKSTFTAVPDPATQTTVLKSYDPTSPGGRLHQDVYLTNMAWVDPATQAITNQTPNLARMVVDGKGDVTYLNRSEFNPLTGDKTYYVYEGGHSFYRYRTTTFDAVVEVDQAVNWDLAQPPASFTYERRMSHTIESTCHRVTTRKDALGQTVIETRDPVTGALLAVSYPDGTSSHGTYTPIRLPLVVTDRLGRTTTQVLDGNGNPLSQVLPDGSSIDIAYNGLGQPISSSDANGHVTTYAYDAAGLLATVTEPLDQNPHPNAPPNAPPEVAAVHTYEYDVPGRMTAEHDPKDRITSHTYDGEDRIVSSSYHDGTTDLLAFGTGPNDGGRPVLYIDRLGSQATHLYDDDGLEVLRAEAFATPEPAIRACSYLKGTTLPEVCTDRGERTTYTYDDHNREIAVVRQVGSQKVHRIETTYDLGGRVFFSTDEHGRKTYYAYDINNRKTREIQELNKDAIPPLPPPPPKSPWANSYRLMKIDRVPGANAPYRILDTVYDAAGQVVQQTDGRGIRWDYTYDVRGNRIREIENAAAPAAQQAKTEYDYDALGNRIRIRHPRHFSEPGGFVTEYTYTGRNLLKTLTLAAGRPEQAVERYFYDRDQRMKERLDARGNTWIMDWDPGTGLQAASIDPPADVDGNPITPDTRAAHVAARDSLGNITYELVVPDASALPPFPISASASISAPPGTVREVTTRFDARYRPIARTVWLQSPGPVMRNAPPIASDASLGLTTRWAYDDDLTDNVGLSLTYAAKLVGLDLGPGSDGSAVEETNPAGDKTVTVRDGVGRVIETIDGLGAVTRTSYDQVFIPPPGFPADCPLSMPWAVGDHALVETITTDPLGHTTSVFSDGGGRTVGTMDAEGQISVLGLDAICNILCERDGNDVGLDHTYDVLNREATRTDTLGDTVSFTHDLADNEVVRTDSAGNSSTAIYDGRNRRVSFTDRNGATTSTTYDAAGNPLERTDGEGKLTSYTHDARNLKTEEHYAGGATRHFTYDAAKRPRTRVNEAGESTKYTHDRADRLTKRAHPSVPGVDEDTFAYDAAGRMTSASSSHYATVVQRAWDAAGQMTGETLTVDGQSYVVGHAHDAASRETGLTYPDGEALTRMLTARGSMAEVKLAGTLVASFTYDAGKRRTATTFGNPRAETRSYRPDDRIQHIEVQGVTDFGYSYSENKLPLTQTNAVNLKDGQAYAYDDNDRLVGFARTSGDTQSWVLSPMGDWDQVTINGVNETRVHDDRHQLITRDNTSLQYGANRGNLTSDGVASSYTWDGENRLESAVVGNAQVAYAYDALGRRVKKTVSNVKTIFVYDGWRAIAEYAGGAAPSTPARRFVFGEALDDVLMMSAGANRYYYHGNNLSSVYALTDQSGAIVEGYRYDPYGKVVVLSGAGVDHTWFTEDDVVAATSPLQNPYTYTGQRADDETGLFYYKNRYYSPALGRFLSRDPRHYDEDLTYVYAGDEPIGMADPEGTDGSHSCGRCCMLETTTDWNILVSVDPGLAPTIATGVALNVYGRLRDGTWTTGRYKLAAETYLKPDAVYAYNLTPDASIGSLNAATLNFQTSYDTIPGSYQVTIPVY